MWITGTENRPGRIRLVPTMKPAFARLAVPNDPSITAADELAQTRNPFWILLKKLDAAADGCTY